MRRPVLMGVFAGVTALIALGSGIGCCALSAERYAAEKYDAPVYVGLGNAVFLDGEGVPHGVDLDWWQSVTLSPEVTFSGVPAQHGSNRGLCDRAYTLWTGFVLSGPAGNVYFAGDTGYGSHFRQVGERFAPIRLAILHIGAYRPRWFMAPVHISPWEAVQAYFDLGATTGLAMHFGTFALGDDGEQEPPAVLRQAVAAAKEPARFWALDFGEGRDVPPTADKAM